MGGQKPHLLVRTPTISAPKPGSNTRLHQVLSSGQTRRQALDHPAAVPVHVVERVESFDCVGRNRFVTRNAYHHGYYDGVEREFRGFGMVEQMGYRGVGRARRSEQLSAGDNIERHPMCRPCTPKTWFHTGVYLGRKHVSDFFAGLLNTTIRASTIASQAV